MKEEVETMVVTAVNGVTTSTDNQMIFVKISTLGNIGALGMTPEVGRLLIQAIKRGRETSVRKRQNMN
jgi:hypothetical protein